MARRVELHPAETQPELRRTPERDAKLQGWLQLEIVNCLSARHQWENVVREGRRQYEGVPRIPVRNTPIPNAPNIEIPIGAIAVDSIYAIAIDALFAASPLLVVRPTDTQYVEAAKAMQRWVNWMADNEVRLRWAVTNTFLNDVQLGTGVYYIPFVEHVRKTDIHRVVERHPEIIPIAPENLFVSATSQGDLQQDRWIGLRFWYTETEISDRARANPGWDVSQAMPIATIDHLRQQREAVGHIRGSTTVKKLYEFVDVYCYFDYNEDGEDEDLLVTYDRAANRIIALGYNPYDRRPVEMMRYQPRAHLPYGMGVMEMLRPFQQEATDLHNYKILNALLSSCKLYVASTTSGVTETMEVWPSKVILVNDIAQFQSLPMSDANAGLAVYEQAGLGLAEQRVGLRGELSLMARGGNRTPATTALAILQQANRRFTPAFDEMRLGTAAAVRQALWRYSERVKARGDDFDDIVDHLVKVLGSQDAQLIMELLADTDFEEAVAVEFTAASATVSRESDRQNALLLMNVIAQSHQRTVELMAIATNEQMPPAMRESAMAGIKAGNEALDRLLRTFDQVRDPQAFIPQLDETMAGVREGMKQQAQMQQALASMVGGAANGGLQPPPAQAPGPMAPPPAPFGVA